MKILIAEDDKHIREGLMELLRMEGYETLPARDGPAALELFEKQNPEFVLLDIMMPGMDGYSVCREIRRRNARVPVIFISAKSQEIDRVLGLELGADDYIMKPFGAREVVARIRAVTRRCLALRTDAPDSAQRLLFGDLEVIPGELRGRRGDKTIDFSLRDVKILKLLHRHRGRIVDRNTLFDECWGQDYLPTSRTLDQHISKLRKLIETDPQNPRIIRTVHGVGYRYED
ncbi:MAG: response regulator transcription factor [Nitrospinaceae bacterium]|jgi:DNA-binding response OmpR family regulator|nr:MAG: response regulator transcription factor [Nitrospinaceae bacterium]